MANARPLRRMPPRQSNTNEPPIVPSGNISITSETSCTSPRVDVTHQHRQHDVVGSAEQQADAAGEQQHAAQGPAEHDAEPREVLGRRGAAPGSAASLAGRRRVSSAPRPTLSACASKHGHVPEPARRSRPSACPPPCELNWAMVAPVTARITLLPATSESRLSRAGFENALRQPIATAAASTIASERRPVRRPAASTSGGSAASTCSQASRRRASRRSARAPPTSSSNRPGSRLAICTIPTHCGACAQLAHHQPGQHHLLEADAAEPGAAVARYQP